MTLPLPRGNPPATAAVVAVTQSCRPLSGEQLFGLYEIDAEPGHLDGTTGALCGPPAREIGISAGPPATRWPAAMWPAPLSGRRRPAGRSARGRARRSVGTASGRAHRPAAA